MRSYAFPKWLHALARDERGLTTVEYVIVLFLIAAVAVASWQNFGAKVQEYLGRATDAIGTEMDKPLPTVKGGG
jgi:Flp pilus assembly pilin Flp